MNSLDTVIRLTLHVLEQKRNLGGEAAVQVPLKSFSFTLNASLLFWNFAVDQIFQNH